MLNIIYIETSELISGNKSYGQIFSRKTEAELK